MTGTLRYHWRKTAFGQRLSHLFEVDRRGPLCQSRAMFTTAKPSQFVMFRICSKCEKIAKSRGLTYRTPPAKKETLKIYLSAGWFDPFQEKAISYLEEYLFSRKDFEVFSPRKEIIISNVADDKEQTYVFEQNVKNIDECDIVVSSTVGRDMGTLWENGYAWGSKKPIVYTFFDERFQNAKFNVMLSKSGVACFTDKQEFEAFMKELTVDNFKTLTHKWKGQVE